MNVCKPLTTNNQVYEYVEENNLVVVDFLTLPSTHEWWFGALVVDIGPEVVHVWLRRFLRFFNSSVDFCLRILVKLL